MDDLRKDSSFCSFSRVWNGHDFSLCFENIIFGLSPDVVTVVLICIYGIQYSAKQRQDTYTLINECSIKRSILLELLASFVATLSFLEIFQFLLKNLDGYTYPWHTWVRLTSQFLAQVYCCWALHSRYEIILAYTGLLRLWWFLRPFLHLPFLRTMLLAYEVVLSSEFLVELFLFILSSIFGILVYAYGRRISFRAQENDNKSSKLTDPLMQRDDNTKSAYSKSNGQTSIWGSLMFTWVTPLMNLGLHQQLSFNDLLPLPESLDPAQCSKTLLNSWVDECKKTEREPSLIRAIYHVYIWRYLGIGILKVVNDTLGLIGPLLLNAILRNLEAGQNKQSHFGFWCVFYLGLISASRAFLGTQYTFLVSRLKLQLRASINILVYHKALCIGLCERSAFSNGEIQTFMSVDAERIVNLCASFHELWSLPLQMVAALLLLYMQVKFAFLSGVSLIILLIPVNRWIALKISTASKFMMKEKDERVRKTGELLMYIRTIKMYTWELLFANRIMKTREEEMKHLQVRKYLDAWCVYFWATTPILFSLFTFGAYALFGNTLTAATVFTSLALFNMLISPLNSFPWVVNGLVEAAVSLQRLHRFLSCPEISLGQDSGLPNNCMCSKDSLLVGGEDNTMLSIVIHDAEFSWSDSNKAEESHLKNISLEVPQGSLVLLSGEVGSGKSSLLQAMLGEMRCNQGEVILRGSLAYVPQNPWIISGSLRDNILLGKEYNEQKYSKIMAACALDVDVCRMAGKDLSIIGERGFNLSGGQRVRLALARAIYQDCDIYLLDDPLSAVDAHVASWILKHAIRGPFLEGKTIIISTYHPQALALADSIVLMKTGSIEWFGNIAEFNNYLLQGGKNVLDGKQMIVTDGKVSQHRVFYNGSPSEAYDNDRVHSMDLIEDLDFSVKNVIPVVEEEIREEGRVQPFVYWSYVTFVGWQMVLLIFMSTALMQLTRNGSDWWLSYWVDSSTQHNSDNFFLMVLCGFSFLNSCFTLSRAFSFAYGGICAAFRIHNLLLKQIISAPISFFEQNPIGRILNRFSSDQYAIDDSLPFIANILLANFFGLLGIIIVICIVQWAFILVLLPLAYIYLNLQKYYRATSRELRRLDSTSRSPIYSSFTEALDGASTIRAFKYQPFFTKMHEEKVSLNQQASFSEIAASLWLTIRLQLLASFIIFFIGIMAIVTNDKKSPFTSAKAGLVGLALSYATPIISLLGDLLSTFAETEKEMVSMERIQQFMQLSEEKNEGQMQIDPNWPMEGSIEFIQVSLVYKPSLPPSLQDLSFFINGGKQVGIVGRTGAGKSSVLNALFRMAPITRGIILIDAIDTLEIDIFQLRSRVAVVPQNPFLFEGTVRENLDPTGNQDDIKLWETLDKCHLKQLILKAGGLDSHVTESGRCFSLGQCQLFCLARSLLRDVKILCLDECTANVDPQTTSLLKNTIADECKGMTVIVIAHRLSTILDLDHVLLLDQGKLVEEGNPHMLLSSPGSRFQDLAKASCS